MSRKNRHQVEGHSHSRIIDTPCIDELAMFSDDELGGRTAFIVDTLQERLDPQEARLLQEELSYVQREQQVRQARRQRHRQYMNEYNSYDSDESFLPEFRGTPPPFLTPPLTFNWT